MTTPVKLGPSSSPSAVPTHGGFVAKAGWIANLGSNVLFKMRPRWRWTAGGALVDGWRRELKKASGRLPNWSKSVANKDYIERLKQVIFHLHKATATWVKSVPVHEIFRGKTLWKGDVEVFDLSGHPKAKRCYGWSYGEPEQFITILEPPPVDSAECAVKVGVAHQIKKERK